MDIGEAKMREALRREHPVGQPLVFGGTRGGVLAFALAAFSIRSREPSARPLSQSIQWESFYAGDLTSGL
jgi:hypothetical protein